MQAWHRFRAAALVAAMGLSAFGARPALAGAELPPGCNGTGVAIAIEAREGGSATLGPVTAGDVITYRVFLAQPLPTGCNFFGGQLSVTLPNGQQVQLAGFGGPTPPVPVVDFLTPFIIDSPVPYVVSNADAVNGFLTARADYGGTTARPGQVNGTFQTDPPQNTASATTSIPLPINDVPTNGDGGKSTVLYWSKVEIRWDGAGNVLQDTFVDVVNDNNQPTDVQLYFVNGDPEAAAGELGPGERAHPGWNWVDVKIHLTANQPAYWSALSGMPGPGGAAVPSFTVLDPSGDPTMQGRPADDGTNDRVLRGFIVGWAVDGDDCQVSWNHLKGDAMLINYAVGSAWEYNAWGFRAAGDPPAGTPIGTCGELRFDGVEFTQPFGLLLLDFYASGSMPFSGGQPFQDIVIDTDLTLHPVDVDLRQETDGPVTTKANFVVWNENETQFTGLHRCITCWDQTLLSLYAPFANHFLVGNLQTDKGKSRIDGLQSQNCDVDFVIENPPLPLGADPRDIVSQDAAILGLAAKYLVFNGVPRDRAGTNLVGMGHEPATILYDPVTGGPPTATGGRTAGPGAADIVLELEAMLRSAMEAMGR